MEQNISRQLMAVGLVLVRYPIAILALGGSYIGFVNHRSLLFFVAALTVGVSIANLKKLKAPFGEAIRMPVVFLLFVITIYLAG